MSVNFAAEAWDNPGGSGVNRVDFHVYYSGSWHFVGSDSTAPYNIGWGTPSDLGSQQLRFTVHVYDNAGNRVTDPSGYHYVNYQAPAAQQVAILVHGWQYNGATLNYKYTCKNDKGGPNIVPYDGGESEFGLIAKELRDNNYRVYLAFWDTGTRTPSLGWASNCLRDEIRSKIDEDPDRKVTIIAHSMGGIVSRAYIEGDYFDDDGYPVDKLITFGSPHTGINASPLLLGPSTCVASPALCYVSTQWMLYFNATHRPSGKVPYAFIGGTSPGSSPFKPLRWTEGPYDGLIGNASATGHNYIRNPIGALIVRSVGGSDVKRWQNNTSHISQWGTSYFTSDESVQCLRQFLSLAGARGCSEYQRTTLTTQRQLNSDEVLADTSFTRSYSGTLTRGESRTFPVRLDGSAAQVVVSYDRGDLDFTLTAPDGTVITGKDAAQLLAGGNYEQHPATAFPPLAMYSMQNPTVGEWNATITATNIITSTDFVLYGAMMSPVTLGVHPVSSVAMGERFAITAELANGEIAVNDATVEAALVTPNGTTYTTLRPTTNGMYQGEMIAPTNPGQYQLSIRASGTTPQPFTRQRDLQLYVRTDDVQQNGSATVQAIDDNNNGRYDRLQITVPLRVKVSASYLVGAVLHSANGEVIANTNVQPSWDNGLQTLTLEFDGRNIGMTGKNGPYTVELQIVSGDQLQLSVDEQSLVQTSPYIADQFEGGSLKVYLPIANR
ncbi:MAG: hypothetical protein M3R24_32250 [Chloroflexota bacterium]|nr:hypothetical protein [Chloroflexota bacterium]